ncbi:MAG: glycosyltransferase family 2 protein [Patescibacteria group bacterium]
MNLSIIILSHNVSKLLKKAIESIYKTYGEKDLQIIVVDNASSDGTVEMIKKKFPKIDLVISNTNTGFAAGNNLARKMSKGDIVLFLNPDTEVKGNAIKKCLEILTSKDELGAITCKVMLPNGKIDYSCHRGLPTVWNTFCYWSGISKLFSKSSFFAGYGATYLDINKSNYIDCISGTFLMIKKEVLNKVNWWDEDYWWNGEDIEICYKIKKAGYKIWYEPSETIIHYKGSSSGLWSTSKSDVVKETKIKSAKSAAKAMRIFVNKHSNELGPLPIILVVKLGIFILEKYRLWKIDKGIKYA